MKGTLFSADFVKDSTGNLRLLELNTDTAFTSGALSHVNFTDFVNVLSTNTINEVHIIGKPMHENFIEYLSQSLHTLGFIDTFSKTIESANTIYPTIVEDSSTKFILRCAYDESAIFDSTYCKQKEEIFSLFYDNNDTGSLAEFYISSSNLNIDCLRKENNSQFIPDVAVKDITNVHGGIQFYKIHGSGSSEQNFLNFIEEIGNNKLITNYYFNNDNIQTSYRSFNIVYGNNLDVINLTNVITPAVFEKPNFIEYNENSNFTLIDVKHYYEFTTNYPLFKGVGTYGGIFEDETITDTNGNSICVASASIGNIYKSLFIAGSPDTDNSFEFMAWSSSGSELPSGSFITSSVLVNSIKHDLRKKLITHIITEDSASFRITSNQHLLVYDSVSDTLRYKFVNEIDTATDFLLRDSGGLSAISSNEIEVLEDTHFTYVLDFEDVDTYFLHDSGINIKVVAHNACFPKGTRITLENGEIKNIEDILEGDTLISYDTYNKIFTTGRVSKLNISNQAGLIHLKTDSNHELKLTLGHRIYSNNKWVEARQLRMGDVLVNSNGDVCKIIYLEFIEGEFDVYHILNVGNDHTYFANQILVHNYSHNQFCFIAGTQISMADSSEKNIEDVLIGEEVLSYNEETGVIEAKKVTKLNSPIHDDLVEYTLSNGIKITSTFDHPYYVNGLHLASYQPNWTNERYDLLSEVAKIKVGDLVNLVNKENVQILSIAELDKVDTQTYIISVEDNKNFYANKVLVHNK